MNHLYHIAFDATFVSRLTILGEMYTLVEGHFIGKQIGEFKGTPATGKVVNVPMFLEYDFENEMIKRCRIYNEMPVMLQTTWGANGIVRLGLITSQFDPEVC
ncbi:MAG: hypothetical protein ACYC7M_08775 [Bellilinea sp.]